MSVFRISVDEVACTRRSQPLGGRPTHFLQCLCDGISIPYSPQNELKAQQLPMSSSVCLLCSGQIVANGLTVKFGLISAGGGGSCEGAVSANGANKTDGKEGGHMGVRYQVLPQARNSTRSLQCLRAICPALNQPHLGVAAFLLMLCVSRK